MPEHDPTQDHPSGTRWCALVSVDGHGPFEVATGERPRVGGVVEALQGLALGCGVPLEAWAAELPADRAPHGVPTVHVWPQRHWHADATVATDRAGALALLAALVAAVRDGTGTAEVFGFDGEGYSLVVVVDDPDDPDRPEVHPGRRFDVWASPYTDPVAGGPALLHDDHDVAALLDVYDALGAVERSRVPDELAARLEVLHGRVRGPLPSSDDPRSAR